MKRGFCVRVHLACAVFAFALLCAPPAFAAACSGSPPGNEGDMMYNLTYHVMQYCNGTSWINVGSTSAVNFGTLTTGDFCTATSGTQISCTTAAINLASQVTGVNNGSNTITLGGSLTTSGAYPLTLTMTMTGITNVTLPTSGTLLSTTSSIGTSQISGVLSVANGGTGASSLIGVLKDNGTGAITAMNGIANYVARWTDANTLGTGVLYDNGTNVGIVTTALVAPLQVRSATNTNLIVYGSGSNTTTISSVNDANGAWEPLQLDFTSLSLAPSGAVAVTVNSSGNVGIGTTVPGEPLDVSGIIRSNSDIISSAPWERRCQHPHDRR